jgi:hypothetical protein
MFEVIIELETHLWLFINQVSISHSPAYNCINFYLPVGLPLPFLCNKNLPRGTTFMFAYPDVSLCFIPILCQQVFSPLFISFQQTVMQPLLYIKEELWFITL